MTAKATEDTKKDRTACCCEVFEFTLFITFLSWLHVLGSETRDLRERIGSSVGKPVVALWCIVLPAGQIAASDFS
jgi:hypothetical protein